MKPMTTEMRNSKKILPLSGIHARASAVPPPTGLRSSGRSLWDLLPPDLNRKILDINLIPEITNSALHQKWALDNEAWEDYQSWSPDDKEELGRLADPPGWAKLDADMEFKWSRFRRTGVLFDGFDIQSDSSDEESDHE